MNTTQKPPARQHLHTKAHRSSVLTPRFRSNPVEVVVFAIIFLTFLNSIYNLFYDHSGGFHPVALRAMKANPLSEGRAPASIEQPLLTLEVPCDEDFKQETPASKLRLNGAFCGVDPHTQPEHLIKSSIVNASNKFAATVFADSSTAKFSTDYIPLQAGLNLIQFEFSYHNGKTISRKLQIIRN